MLTNLVWSGVSEKMKTIHQFLGSVMKSCWETEKNIFFYVFWTQYWCFFLFFHKFYGKIPTLRALANFGYFFGLKNRQFWVVIWLNCGIFSNVLVIHWSNLDVFWTFCLAIFCDGFDDFRKLLGNFWKLLGDFWKLLGHFWKLLGKFDIICAIFLR